MRVEPILHPWWKLHMLSDRVGDFEVSQSAGKFILKSPLRYPGGKKRLANYIERVIKINGLHPKLFIEPFAGGAAVSLYLLSNGVVDKIALGEKDPLIAAFWKVAFNDTDWLINKIESTSITLKQWKKLKNMQNGSIRDKAFACLFLNRTSFSGILNSSAGPLGGWKQKSDYKIDCRFPIKTIVRNLRNLHEYRDKVEFIFEGNWQRSIEKTQKLDSYEPDDLFFYLDPPFYNKAERLYRYYFKKRNHTTLCHKLSEIGSNWLVSYDPDPNIIKMYSENGFAANSINVLYSPNPDGIRYAQEIILTNLISLPQD